ncbi:hypothetical protein NC651_015124 [Populus alba x Populus x berolinensis]|nr:hypothetical protein NC651_015124 [Populus alba x Populus x berolinensis]
MAMPWSMAIWIANMVWVGLIGLVSTCLTVADELASSLRAGDIGPFHVSLARFWETLLSHPIMSPFSTEPDGVSSDT